MPWGWFYAAFCVLFLASIKLHLHVFGDPIWLDDIKNGMATMCLLVYCTCKATSPSSGKAHWLLGIFSAPVLVKLGAFSYSLYLLHQPLEALFYLSIHSLPLSIALRMLIMLFICLPLVLLCAYLFHLAAEKPFLSRRAAKRQQTEDAG